MYYAKDDMELDALTEILIKFSVGMAVYPIESEDYQGLMYIADERMYADKPERNEERRQNTQVNLMQKA